MLIVLGFAVLVLTVGMVVLLAMSGGLSALTAAYKFHDVAALRAR